MSGSPMPKDITSIPFAFFSAIVFDIPTNKYGSIFSNLLDNFMFTPIYQYSTLRGNMSLAILL